MINMEDLYAAGFFDGEGCCMIQKNYQVKVVVSQKKPQVLFRFKAKYGGQVYLERPNQKYHCINQWLLQTKEEQLVFLRAIQPYLITKIVDAELAIKMLELSATNSTRPQAKNGRYLPNPNNKEREEIYKAYKELRAI